MKRIKQIACISITTRQELEAAFSIYTRNYGLLDFPFDGSLSLGLAKGGTYQLVLTAKFRNSKLSHYRQFLEATRNEKHSISCEHGQFRRETTHLGPSKDSTSSSLENWCDGDY